jgi:hypothetical protein
VIVLVAGLGLVGSGCDREETKERLADSKSGLKQPAPVTQNHAGDHSGWWCSEHGVPEEVCGQCNARLAATFKKKGDWCQEHDRPDSQCFLHHPDLKPKFAAQYRAKYGKEPPQTEDEEAAKDGAGAQKQKQ